MPIEKQLLWRNPYAKTTAATVLALGTLAPLNKMDLFYLCPLAQGGEDHLWVTRQVSQKLPL